MTQVLYFQYKYSKTTLNLRPYFAGSMGGLKMEWPLYKGSTWEKKKFDTAILKAVEVWRGLL